MRFVENGPSLPAHLLEEQAQGNVIFFCGAGVSMPAGLDSFWALTNRIIDTLDATKARKALADNESFDRVFNVLVREFGREEIDSQIYTALGVGKPRTLKHHRDILALSRGTSGNPQIVTTNFDRLFEQAGRDVRPIVPPGLPDIELNQPIRGVVYLHGRLFLLPMFQLDHPLAEAAWHGLAFNRNAMPAPFWQQFKAPMLAILKGDVGWRLDEQEREYFGSLLVWLSRPVPDIAPLFSFEEIRDALTAIDDDLRGRILWTLGNSLQEHGQWTAFIKPFIENSWPRALRYRSDETTRGFVQIAEQAGDHFPDAVKTILPLIRPVPNADMLTYRISKDRKDKENIARKHPQVAMRLLNAITPDDRARMPYELSGALDALAELDPRVKDMAEYRRLKGLLE